MKQRTAKHAVNLLGLEAHLHVTRTEPAPEMPRWWQPHQQGPLRSRRHLCFAAQRRLAVLSRASTPEGSLHPFGQGDVARAQPLSGRLPASLRLLPPPLPAALAGRLAASLPVGSNTGEQRAYHVPQVEHDGWFRPRLFAGGAASASEELGASEPDHVPSWPKPDSEAAVRRARPSRSSAASLACSL